mmetsp:Transcript_10213/g.32770  ORF Transcript_10213/g.32770 Transcript_10213/m.32770 type:complete len:200 (+) Transcript_10213:548-1147(+)
MRYDRRLRRQPRRRHANVLLRQCGCGRARVCLGNRPVPWPCRLQRAEGAACRRAHHRHPFPHLHLRDDGAAKGGAHTPPQGDARRRHHVRLPPRRQGRSRLPHPSPLPLLRHAHRRLWLCGARPAAAPAAQILGQPVLLRLRSPARHRRAVHRRDLPIPLRDAAGAARPRALGPSRDREWLAARRVGAARRALRHRIRG